MTSKMYYDVNSVFGNSLETSGNHCGHCCPCTCVVVVDSPRILNLGPRPNSNIVEACEKDIKGPKAAGTRYTHFICSRHLLTMSLSITSVVQVYSLLMCWRLSRCWDYKLGYLRSAFSSRKSIQLFKNLLPLESESAKFLAGRIIATYRPTVSESPTIHKCRFGRVIATMERTSVLRWLKRVLRHNRHSRATYRSDAASRPRSQPRVLHCCAQD